MVNEFMGAIWPQGGFLRSAARSEVEAWLSTLANGELGSVATQDMHGGVLAALIDAFARRGRDSSALAEIRLDAGVPLVGLETILVALVLALKEIVREDTRAVDSAEDDLLSPRIPIDVMRHAETRLREMGEFLRTGVFEGVDLGRQLANAGAADHLDEIARKMAVRIRYRRGRERIRNSRPDGAAGAPMKPETIVAVAVYEILDGKRIVDRCEIASRLIDEVFEISVSADQLRARLNEYRRRNPRK